MSFKVKILVASVLIAVLVVGCVAFAAEGGIELLAASDAGTYVVSVGDATMTVDKSNLHFTVTKNGATWDSGKRACEDDDLNPFWVNKVQDAVTVGYRTLSANNTIERALSNLNPRITFKELSNGFNARILFGTLALSLTLQVRLSNDGVTVTVPYDSIEEEHENLKLQYLQIYPAFDSSYQLVDGQILLPDGSGAVVDLSQNTKAKKPYLARVYGADYGIVAPPVTSNAAYTASAPVFAFMYPDHGSMVVAESGAEYCSINAAVSTITTRYNMAYYNWIYREEYTKYFQSAGVDGDSYVAFQKDMNKFDLVQKMYFLDAASSVTDVAKAYRNHVELQTKTFQNKNAGLRLSFLMAENKQGMFGKETVNVTTTSFIQSKIKEVASYCDNMYVSVFGYTKGGLSGSYPNHFPLDSGSGGRSGYLALSKTVNELGGRFAMEADFIRCDTESSFNNRHLALNMSNQFITLNDSRSGSGSKFYLVNADYVSKLIADSTKNFSRYTTNLDFASIGSLLYSGYESSDFTRQDAVKYFCEALDGASFNAYVKTPNSYLWRYIDGYLDMPVSSSNYLIETSSVPFLQMILSGTTEMYSQPFNLNYTGVELILRLIDYNVYPSFILTEKDSIDLYGTNSSGIFTSNYDLWGSMVQSVYQQVNGVLSRVSGETMESRYCPANGVSATLYSNGVTVLVNYTNVDVTVGSVVVPAQNAVAATL